MNSSDPSPFTCTYEEFKAQAGSYFRRLQESPAPTEAQIENGFKALGLAYLNLEGATEIQKHEAVILIQLASKFSCYARLPKFPA